MTLSDIAAWIAFPLMMYVEDNPSKYVRVWAFVVSYTVLLPLVIVALPLGFISLAVMIYEDI